MTARVEARGQLTACQRHFRTPALGALLRSGAGVNDKLACVRRGWTDCDSLQDPVCVGGGGTCDPLPLYVYDLMVLLRLGP